jgi:hypothetical protein
MSEPNEVLRAIEKIHGTLLIILVVVCLILGLTVAERFL